MPQETYQVSWGFLLLQLQLGVNAEFRRLVIYGVGDFFNPSSFFACILKIHIETVMEPEHN